jgi:hypothetical protein
MTQLRLCTSSVQATFALCLCTCNGDTQCQQAGPGRRSVRSSSGWHVEAAAGKCVCLIRQAYTGRHHVQQLSREAFKCMGRGLGLAGWFYFHKVGFQAMRLVTHVLCHSMSSILLPCCGTARFVQVMLTSLCLEPPSLHSNLCVCVCVWSACHAHLCLVAEATVEGCPD